MTTSAESPTTGQTRDFVRVLGAGDSFGELGVLYDVPRTATVRCAAPGTLLRIPGKAFLDALDTGSRQPPQWSGG